MQPAPWADGGATIPALIAQSLQALEPALSELLNLKENTLVANPAGGFSFGTIPDMPKFGLPGGQIYLRVGVHRRANSGFGVIHVWEAHRADLLKHGCNAIEGIAALLAKMIVTRRADLL